MAEFAPRPTSTSYCSDKNWSRQIGKLGATANQLGSGVLELKVNYGPGYRVYFGQVGTKLVILLCGGDKSSQNEDITRAMEYWEDYKK